MKKKPRIALFVANHTRDLPGMVLTAWELSRRGATCYLIPYRYGRDEVWALAPDFVLLPVMRPFQADQTRQFVEAGIQFGLLDTEGSVWSSMDEYKQTLWDDRELTSKANCICFWGPKVAEHTVSDGIFTKKQTFITGCPRFDYYTEPLASIYRQSINGQVGGSRKSVLINTNFTTANAEKFPYPTVIDNYVARYGFDREEVMRWYKNGLDAIDGMSELANHLASDFPEIDIIVRPHPEEQIDTYRDKLAKSPNIKLSNSSYVAPWILSASAIIQRSCTTAIEACLAGIPAYSPQWIPAPSFYPIPEAVSLPVDDYDQLRTSLQTVLDGSFQMPQSVQSRIGEITEDWFHKIDGLAFRRVADAILDSLSIDIVPDNTKCQRFLHRLPSNISEAQSKLGDKARYLLGLSPRFSFRQMKSSNKTQLDEYFNEQGINGLIDSVGRALGNTKIRASRANDSGAYLNHRFRGRAFLVESQG